MKFGLISDTHLHNWEAFGQCRNGQISKRLLQQKDNFLEAVGYFKKQGVDCIIHVGDWGHIVGTVSNEVLIISTQILYSIDLPIVLVIGNHDTPVRVSPQPHHIITNLLNDLRVKVPIMESFNKSVFIINYHDEVDYDKVKDYDLVVVHKTPVGSVLGAHTFNDGINWRKLAAQNKFVAFGHIHQMQKLSMNCFVIGSPMKLGFGEIGDRGVWIVDTIANKCHFHKLSYPDFVTVSNSDEIKDDGNYYRCPSLKKIDNDNVVSVATPPLFNERIKAQDFDGIILEWLVLNGKPQHYLDPIKDILGEKLTLGKDVYQGRLSKVLIKNFLSVGFVEYDVPETGFTLITGDSDSFSSNGSGKSTIIGESICWCLFGETTKGLTGDDVVRRSQTDCEVTLILKDAKTSHCIKRTRKNGLCIDDQYCGDYTTLQYKLTQGLRAEDKQKILHNILGFAKSLFLASDYFSQETPMMLARLTDTEKTNMVTDLLGFEKYDELLDKVQAKTKTVEEEIKKQEVGVVGLKQQLAVSHQKMAGVDEAIEKQAEVLSGLWDSITESQERISEFEQQKKAEGVFEKVDYASQIAGISESQEKHQNQITALYWEIDTVQEKDKDISVALSTLKLKSSTLLNEQLRIGEEIAVLEKGPVGARCDRCGSIVTEDSIKALINETKYHRLNEIEAELATIELDIEDKGKASQGIKEERDKLRTKVAEVNFEHAKEKAQISELTKLKDSQDKKEKEFLVQAQKTLGAVEAQRAVITETKRRIMKVNEDIDEINIDKVNINMVLVQIQDKIQESGKVVDAHNITLEKLAFFHIAFSPKGIPSVLLDRFCNDINAILNGYLSTISAGSMSIMVTPTKTTKGGEERNKIGMSIQLNGNEAKYESLSGGEKRRVDVSLCFGLNKFVSEKYRVPSGLLGIVILDEVFSFLDKSGEEAVAELLREEGKTKSVFVVDHALNLSSYADRVWVVKKEKDISSLEMVGV